jgi:FeS assembly SUF system protein
MPKDRTKGKEPAPAEGASPAAARVPVASPAAAAAPSPAPAAPASAPAAPPPAGAAPAPFATNPVLPGLAAPKADLREAVIETLQGIYDPEIPVNVYDLGLVYAIDVTPAGEVAIRMTLTSPACPVAESLPPEVKAKVGAVPGVTAVKVDLVWEPPWGKHLLSEAARLQLGLE